MLTANHLIVTLGLWQNLVNTTANLYIASKPCNGTYAHRILKHILVDCSLALVYLKRASHMPYETLNELKLDRGLVLIGLMGAGKSSVGRLLAKRLDLTFRDADDEIEKAAGFTIEDYFERHGEAAFREGEHKIITRLLDGPPHVLATGGGAFMDSRTRAVILKRGISIWLRADIDILLERVMRRGNRPLLKRGNPRKIMENLSAERDPIYATADLTVTSAQEPHEEIVERIVAALKHHCTEAAMDAD